MNRALIFGVGGFVGAYLSKELINHGYEVYGSDIEKTNSIPSEVVFEVADLLDVENINSLILKIQPTHIINLAAISSVGLSWSIPQKTIALNVNGALNIMDAIRLCKKLPKVLFIGSSEEYEDSDKPMNEKAPFNASNPYGISKMAQAGFVEIYRNRYGMKIYYVRPFNHTGIGQCDSFVIPSFCKQIAEIEKSGQPGVIYVGNLAAKRDICNVKDIVKAYRMIVENDDCTKVFNVGSGKAYTIKEILDYVISLCSQNVTIEVDANRFRPLDNPVICCDYSYIEKELGWKPEYSIFETVKELYEFYLK